jgi:hypothetical protein
MLIHFFTCVDYGRVQKTRFESMLETVDHYFYLGGRKVRILREERKENSQGVEWVNEPAYFLITSLKIVSYCTLIIPSIMLIIKWACRSKQTFYVVKKQPITLDLPIRCMNGYFLGEEVSTRLEKRPFFNLDLFITTCAPHQQAMIYGFHTCNYLQIINWLTDQKNRDHFKDVFDCFIGQEEEYLTHEDQKSDKRIMTKIHHPFPPLSIQMSKAGLVNIVLENFKRHQAKLPIIPIIFVVGKDDLKLDTNSLVDRNSSLYKSFTNREIRQAYKLCSDNKLSKEIRDIAHLTFAFISIKTNSKTDPEKFNFTKFPAPWECFDWERQWKGRIETKPKSFHPKFFLWREELIKLADLKQ